MKLLWRAKMSTVQYGGEEVEEGAVYNVTLRRVQIQQAANKGARWLGIEEDQFSSVDALNEYETYKIRTIKAGTLEKLVENLLTASGDNDFTYIIVFLSTYRAFASTKEVLELLLDRYGNLETLGCEEVENQNFSESTEELRSTIASISQVWLEQCSEDFREPPNYPCLLKLLDYLKRNIPDSDPERRAQNLLEKFQSQEMENNYGFHNSSLYNHNDEEELVITCSEDLEFFFFPEDFVAEQLTYMDATLFKRVVPHHCLGCIWSRRNKEENKHLVPTIKATISQFNAVTKCVISTILKSKAVKPQQRAKIIEKWIHIACECRVLKNFSSLRAIISALQSNSIYRLKKSWACVAKDIMQMFHELSVIFSNHDNYLTTRELLMKERTPSSVALDSTVKEYHKRTMRQLHFQKDMRPMQGTVPYLGTFLTDLVMLDTAHQDYIEGGLINFEKRRREFEVIAQIKWLQSACESYCMTPDAKFIQWFRKQQHLTEEESFNLSREIEAAPDTTTDSPKPRKSMVKRLSLLFVSTEMATQSTPFRGQLRFTSGGSSSENTDLASDSSSEEVFIPVKGSVEEVSQKKVSETSESSSLKVSCCSTDISSEVSSLIAVPPLSFKRVSIAISKSSVSNAIDKSSLSDTINEYSNAVSKDSLSSSSDQSSLSSSSDQSSLSSSSDQSFLSSYSYQSSNTIKCPVSSSGDQSFLSNCSDQSSNAIKCPVSSSSDQSFLSSSSEQSSNSIKCPVFSSNKKSFLSAYRDQSFLSSYSNQSSDAIKCPVSSSSNQSSNTIHKCSLFSSSDQSSLLSCSDQSSNTIKCPVSQAINECTLPSSSNQSSLSNAIKKHSVSVTPITSKVLPPVYNRQNEDMCIIRISIENNNGNMYKSILLTSQDKTRAVIQRAMLKHNLEPDTAEDYELVQIISEAKELVLPANANVFYAMNSHVNFDFILRKKASVNGQVQMRCYSPKLSRGAKWGRWTNRPSNIAL